MAEDLANALGGGLLVAEVGSACAGYASFAIAEDRVLLHTVAVDPGQQRRGVARALVAAVERAGRAAQADTVVLYTNVAMDGALALYPSLGFREVDRRREDGFERVYFQKPLAPAVAQKSSVDGLYGRRRTQNFRADPGYETFALDLSDNPADPRQLFAAGVQAVRLEVGFGGGEHLIHEAKRFAHVGHIGVEPFETGMMKAVRAAKAEALANVRLHMGDARRVLDWLPDGSLERVDVLYPDPWHKQRHWKRRFISMEGLTRLARVLPAGATVRFASDIASYVAWTRAHVEAHPAFELERDSSDPWEGWPGTRYEAKAYREGRPPRYLTLLRVPTDR